MTHDKLVTLLQKLEERTSASDIEWERTAYENRFQTTVGGYTLSLSQSESEVPDSYDYVLRIHAADGAIVEAISDEEIHQSVPSFSAYKSMGNIFRGARRSAMGVEQAVDSIIQGLDDLIPF
jgi:hypothetical protein